MENLNRGISNTEIELLVKSLHAKKSQPRMTGEFYQHLKKKLQEFFTKSFRGGWNTSQFVYKTRISLITKPNKDITKKENHTSIFLINIDAESSIKYQQT